MTGILPFKFFMKSFHIIAKILPCFIVHLWCGWFILKTFKYFRSPPKMIEGPDGRNLQLHFRSRLSLPLFTGGKVEGEQGAAIHVVLIDTNTGNAVTSGPEAAAKLDVVVLEGDFNNEDDEDWTQEEFESHVVKEREGKRPLLTGDLQVTLKEGVGTLGDLTFTDNSSWIRSRKFRLGLKIASGSFESIRVREAKTEAFTVKDHRGECGFMPLDCLVFSYQSISPYLPALALTFRVYIWSYLQCIKSIIHLH